MLFLSSPLRLDNACKYSYKNVFFVTCRLHVGHWAMIQGISSPCLGFLMTSHRMFFSSSEQGDTLVHIIVYSGLLTFTCLQIRTCIYNCLENYVPYDQRLCLFRFRVTYLLHPFIIICKNRDLPNFTLGKYNDLILTFIYY